ncbi:DNA gyrase inhibitor YacG [Terrihabitans rhizophilus]|uniref:DNA gyrase inhibitor YacG n=1 Tax=Terrihabitans rhizophilus TaxID=3092662 RepID=A0ABU4RNN3_9HYPH|nr:DNA gyrase inhibitor YacG [Terrihabitans sp. PJ23]MDX6806451.1 DNA gyrase inhibitor YacG [Terrihabitans sp. PJ23]
MSSRAPAGGKSCPICGKPAAPDHRPFCSTRCADVDLNRWLSGAYRVETDEPPSDATSSLQEGEEASGQAPRRFL